MRKIYAIAVAMLVGGLVAQAQPYAKNVKVNQSKAIEVLDEPINGGDVRELTDAERAQLKAERMAAPAAGEAYYYRPAGTFLAGVAGLTTYSYYAPNLIVPPYRTITYKAQQADSYQWKVQLYSNGSRAWYNATSQNVNVTYNYEIDSVASLTVGDSEYYIFGNRSATNPKSAYTQVYAVDVPSNYLATDAAGVYYASPKYFGYRDRDNTGGGSMYYTGSGIGYEGGTGYWYGFNTRGWNGIATYVEKPDNKYVLRGGAVRYAALAWADSTAENQVPLTIDVYKVTNHELDTLALGDKLASATYTLSMDNAASGGFPYVFDEPLEIDDEIAVILSGYDNTALRGFSVSIARDTWDEGHGQHGYVLHMEDGEPSVIKGLKNYLSADRGITAPTILFDIEYPYLQYYYTDGDEATMTFNYSGECTSAAVADALEANQVAFWATYPSTEWKVTGTETSGLSEVPALKAEAVEGDVPEWISLEFEDATSDGEYTGKTTLTVNVEDNTSKQARSAVVSVKSIGTEAVNIIVNQAGNPTGITAVGETKTVQSVSYYNLAGVESDTPFQGVNIEVKKYSDGSRETVKVVK